MKILFFAIMFPVLALSQAPIFEVINTRGGVPYGDTIYVHEKNNPRLSAYKDSLLLHRSSFSYGTFPYPQSIKGLKKDTFNLKNNFGITRSEFTEAKHRLNDPFCYHTYGTWIRNTKNIIERSQEYFAYDPPKIVVVYVPQKDTLLVQWEFTNAGVKILNYKNYNYRVVKQEIYTYDNKKIDSK